MSSAKISHADAPASATGNNIRFVLDGAVVSVADVSATTTVLEYLRETVGRTGTKEGCAEGDCGACTVVLGETTVDGDMRYRAINSCIRFLPTIDGKELVTVESLAGDGDTLHPVQQAMVDQHASQCGFCTPGFVMSLFALYLHNPLPQREDVLDALAGNLCRCTGYRPIIDAGCSLPAYVAPERWSRAAAQDSRHATLLKSIQRDKMLTMPGFRAPRNIDELASAYAAAPQSLLLAGGTDIGLWVTKQLRELPPIIYLGEVDELQRIDATPARLRIGAAVALTDAWEVIFARHPTLRELAQRFASPPVRNSGTLCGNIANGSPIGDAMPALIVLGARIELRCGANTREIALEDFYLGYQKKDLAPGEFVVAVKIPAQQPATLLASYKLSKRIDQDISAVCAAFAITLKDDRIDAVRIAFGGMAAVPARARVTEEALLNQVWNQATIDTAITALAQDFKPLSDMRASDRYRLRGAGNLLQRFFLEHNDETPLLRTHQALSSLSSTTDTTP
ncbi:xanthine dehydrogenase small subunit [Pseudolysobacter antarcticus]|uniref:Xanthine dehydrogenase small subunit n=1 Tax=Pseudolysobacter antarcticus TaxID=2511995 RepID=A0A411HIW0_9GAMM|nr:xanthine dehydrogenase small subunit [Pseudolysobacter antarcticus]QBB70445.1 xanthine dehydrogenase small subunit [Pseudolysobacter antarcticus]